MRSTCLLFLSFFFLWQVAMPSNAFITSSQSQRRYRLSQHRQRTYSRFTHSQPHETLSLWSTRENAEEPNIVVQLLQQLSPAELVFLLGILLLLATITPLTSSATDGEGNIEHGESLFVDNCAACHRGGQNMMKPAKTLQEKDLLKYLGDSDSSTISKFFKGSFQHKMINFPNVPGGKLTETDVEDVAIYVSSQAVQDKW